MKVTIEVDCTPLEARSFFGLPDVTVLNDHLVHEMKNRMDANISMLQPEELMRVHRVPGQPRQRRNRTLRRVSRGES